MVLQAHPLDDSYNMAVLGAVTAPLGGIGAGYALHRFYPDGHPPAELLSRCEHLIVVAPTWWGAMPAIVLEWIQHELGPWIDAGASRSTSPLRSVDRLSIVTSHGSSKLVNMLQGEPGRHLWKRSVLPLCAPDATFDWIALYKIDRLGLGEREAFLRQVEEQIGAVVANRSANRVTSR